MDHKIAYICSPYRGDIQRNVEYAKELTEEAIKRGYAPIVPHIYLPLVLDDSNQASRALGLELALTLLRKCDVILVGKRYGTTPGMLMEILESATLCIPMEEI